MVPKVFEPLKLYCTFFLPTCLLYIYLEVRTPDKCLMIISELKKKDREREIQEKKIQELQDMRLKQEQESAKNTGRQSSR